MNFKKLIAMAGALVLCAGLLTACGDNGSAEAESTSAETTAVSDISDGETVSERGEEGSADNGTETVEEEPADGEETNPLQPLADAAMAAGEWPAMWEVTDPQMTADYFLLDAENENYRNMIILQCPMSANMTELIIIEADDVSSAMTDLEARQKKAREQDAFYPNDVDKAEASIVGSEGDYAYFILAAAPSETEKALAEAIEALG